MSKASAIADVAADRDHYADIVKRITGTDSDTAVKRIEGKLRYQKKRRQHHVHYYKGLPLSRLQKTNNAAYLAILYQNREHDIPIDQAVEKVAAKRGLTIDQLFANTETNTCH